METFIKTINKGLKIICRVKRDNLRDQNIEQVFLKNCLLNCFKHKEVKE
jgi:hypothetical protein